VLYKITLIKDIFSIVIKPEDGCSDPRESEERIFVCGSLMDPEFVAGIIGHPVSMAPAVVKGFSRGWGETGGKRFHFLQVDSEGIVQGMALLGLSNEDIARLEEFEQVPDVRMKMALAIHIGDIILDGHTYIKNE